MVDSRRNQGESMDIRVIHDRKAETPEAKALWFQSLSLNERMALLCEFTDMIFENNPKVVEQKYAQPIEGRI